MHNFFPQAHQHGANADEYLAQGLLIPAAEEYEKAAQAFQECVLVSMDEKVRSVQSSQWSPHLNTFTWRQKERCECYITNMQSRQRMYSARSPSYAKKTKTHLSRRMCHTCILLPRLPSLDPHPHLPRKQATRWWTPRTPGTNLLCFLVSEWVLCRLTSLCPTDLDQV